MYCASLDSKNLEGFRMNIKFNKSILSFCIVSSTAMFFSCNSQQMRSETGELMVQPIPTKPTNPTPIVFANMTNVGTAEGKLIAIGTCSDNSIVQCNANSLAGNSNLL